MRRRGSSTVIKYKILYEQYSLNLKKKVEKSDQIVLENSDIAIEQHLYTIKSQKNVLYIVLIIQL